MQRRQFQNDEQQLGQKIKKLHKLSVLGGKNPNFFCLAKKKTCSLKHVVKIRAI